MSRQRPKRPLVAIIGRPNVGKSTLINRILGKRHAIVHDEPGVTRDLGYYPAKWQKLEFTLVDTGGIFQPSEEGKQVFDTLIFETVKYAIEEADIVVFLVDGKLGPISADEDIAQLVRTQKKPVILAVNKCDNASEIAEAAAFYSLGLGDPIAHSALHGDAGTGNLMDAVANLWKDIEAEKARKAETSEDEQPTDEEAEEIHVVFAGRPNVGKSSLTNALLGENRSIVSDVAGTTRDVIDTRLSNKHGNFLLLDTAGIRKRARVDYGIEMFSVDRALRTISRSDVVVLVVDAEEGITIQEKRIAERAMEKGKGLLVVVNKWDLIEDKAPNTLNDYRKEKIDSQLGFASHVPVLFTSAKTHQRIQHILEWVVRIQKNRMRRISTNVVNQVIGEAYQLYPPPVNKNQTLRISYATQAEVSPPTFILFVNNADLATDNYERYLERRIRENIELEGVPVRIRWRNKTKREAIRK